MTLLTKLGPSFIQAQVTHSSSSHFLLPGNDCLGIVSRSPHSLGAGADGRYGYIIEHGLDKVGLTTMGGVRSKREVDLSLSILDEVGIYGEMGLVCMGVEVIGLVSTQSSIAWRLDSNSFVAEKVIVGCTIRAEFMPVQVLAALRAFLASI